MDQVKRIFNIKDVLFFGGLGMLGYGLHMVFPWLAFAVCGTLLMLAGYAMGDKQ